jgi:hypothetical protein
MSFSGFPPSVTLVSPSSPNILIAPYATTALRFGSGTSQINPAAVANIYNHFFSNSGPTLRASNCRLS